MPQLQLERLRQKYGAMLLTLRITLAASRQSPVNQWKIKYTFVGYLDKHFHYRGVTFAKGKNDTCYQMFPTDKVFFQQPFYFHFTSAVASSLHRGVSRLQAAGFVRVYKSPKDFRESLSAVNFARRLAAKYENELTYEDLKNNRLKENLITLGNFKSVFYAGLIIFLSDSVAIVAEVCIFHYVNRNRAKQITLVMSLS